MPKQKPWRDARYEHKIIQTRLAKVVRGTWRQSNTGTTAAKIPLYKHKRTPDAKLQRYEPYNQVARPWPTLEEPPCAPQVTAGAYLEEPLIRTTF